MNILDSAVYNHIFAWTKSGKSFSIYKPYDLVSDVLAVHFEAKSDMKFDSFLRKVGSTFNIILSHTINSVFKSFALLGSLLMAKIIVFVRIYNSFTGGDSQREKLKTGNPTKADSYTIMR